MSKPIRRPNQRAAERARNALPPSAGFCLFPRAANPRGEAPHQLPAVARRAVPVPFRARLRGAVNMYMVLAGWLCVNNINHSCGKAAFFYHKHKTCDEYNYSAGAVSTYTRKYLYVYMRHFSLRPNASLFRIPSSCCISGYRSWVAA